MNEPDDPFDDFKRKRDNLEQQKKFQQKFQATHADAARQVSRERLEKISDYFPAYVAQPTSAGASSTSVAAGSRPAAAPAPQAVDPCVRELCRLLQAKGILTAEDVRTILASS